MRDPHFSTMPDGRLMHAEIRIGNSIVMLADDFPEYGGKAPTTLGGSPVNVHLYVEDVVRIVAPMRCFPSSDRWA